jgi:hypothetical protein
VRAASGVMPVAPGTRPDSCVVSEKEVFKSSQIQVIGISPDPVDKQKDFVEKQKLTVSGRFPRQLLPINNDLSPLNSSQS